MASAAARAHVRWHAPGGKELKKAEHALHKLPTWVWLAIAGGIVALVLILRGRGTAAAPAGSAPLGSYSYPPNSNLGFVTPGYAGSAGTQTAPMQDFGGGTTSQPTVPQMATPALQIAATGASAPPAPIAVQSPARAVSPAAGTFGTLAAVGAIPDIPQLRGLDDQAAAVATGFSNAPLSGGQVDAIVAANGGAPLTDWQRRFLMTGGNTTIPGAPGGPSSFAFKNGALVR